MVEQVRLLIVLCGLPEGQVENVVGAAGLLGTYVKEQEAPAMLRGDAPYAGVLFAGKPPGVEVVREIERARRHVGVIAAVEGSEEVALPQGSPIELINVATTSGWEHLRRSLELKGRAVELEQKSRRGHAHAKEGLGHLVGGSESMQKVYRLIEKTAHHSYPVLILGESGTGKELVARSIHEGGPLANGPFVPVDCSALAPGLIETELFGHVRGAFTGAMSAKQGLMASAAGGTLFLDEIGNVPVDLQVKLLRAIQEKEIKPVGSNERIRTDARIIAATNRDLEAAIRDGSFRQDLYFRLNVVQIRVPPLRERRKDIPVLARYFMKQFTRDSAMEYQLDDGAMECLMNYQWPGNVRELENAIERAVALSSGPVIHLQDLPSNVHSPRGGAALAPGEIVPMEELERRAIYQAIREARGDKIAAARRLGIGKTTLYRKLREYEKKSESRTD